jgi:hypothetical protein
MRLLLSVSLLALGWFALVNVALSLMAWLVSPRLLRRIPSAGPGCLLLLRLLPAGIAAAFAALLFVPGHLRYEPVDANESFGLVPLGLAVAGLAILARAARRSVRLWLAARRIRRSRALACGRAEAEIHEIEGHPGVSLVGVLRTRILIGSSVRAALTPEEIDAAIAHERAHRHALDNLKRCAMFCAPDLFGGSAAAVRLEERWREQTEHQADRRAVGGDATRAMHLASALLKVARLGAPPAGLAAAPVWSSFHDPALLESRVRRLLSEPHARPDTGRRPAYAAVAAATTVAAIAWATGAFHAVHLLTESLIAVLP